MNSAGAVVLLYHRVADTSDDPFELCVRPDRFAQHLEIVSRIADVVPLPEILGGRTKRRAAITFDDGYADNALVAKPILDADQVPATVFVVSGKVGASRGFWWDELVRIVLQTEYATEFLEFDIDASELWVDIRTRAGRQRACVALQRFLQGYPLSSIEQHLDRLRLRLSGLAKTDAMPRPCTRAELRELAAGGSIQIGAHTVTHSPLARMTVEEQRSEIEQSRAALSELAGEVRAFAYPHGEFTHDTVRIVKETGFALACTSEQANVPDDLDPYRIPRRVVENWTGDAFRAHLRWWFGIQD